MESVKELRKICQDPKECHNFHSFIGEVYRIFTIYITKLLLYIPIEANHVTAFMICIGFISGFLFSIGTYWYALIGAISLEFVFFLDCIDGELARYKKTLSLNGVFLDLIAHLINLSVPLIGITIGLYKSNSNINIVILGLLASTFSVLCLSIQPLKHHVIIKNLTKYVNKTKSKIMNQEIKETKKSSTKSIGKFLNYLYDGFYITKLIILAAIFNKLYWIILFYGLTLPIWWLVKLIHEYKVGYGPYEYLFGPYKK